MKFYSTDALSEVPGLHRNKINFKSGLHFYKFEISVILKQFDTVLVLLMTVNIIQSKAVIFNIKQKYKN